MNELMITQLTLLHKQVTENTIWSFVKVQTKQGLTGWGEATWNRQPLSLELPFTRVQQALIGQSIQNLRRIQFTPVTSQAEAAIHSALEQAWWDICGKQLKINAVQIQGKPHRHKIPLYANINRGIRQRNQQGFKQAAHEAEQAGFNHIKIAPFDSVTPEVAGTREGLIVIKEGLQRVAAARAGLSSTSHLYIDCHWRFNERVATWVISELAQFGVTWFECPLIEITDNIPALKRLRSIAHRYSMRLAGLEELTDVSAFKPWLQAGVYDVVMPDVKYAGGISGLIKVSELAMYYGAAFAPHNPNGPVSHAASLVASAMVENLDRLEHQFNETTQFWQMMGSHFPRPVRGYSYLATEAGLGGDFQQLDDIDNLA
ncbi:hypothetical protein J1786_01865 [Rahnella sp. L72c]|uniref:Mandelate racemase/muconate lactonizing enzyme C-terminal domain-containing protein n=1 Tax=Rahnella perminowiae TaxID=2816244 RepID=A0ABS6KW60_9GAMM|nr:enolase C-terminal domain-like protein [Rahnella perminowiae]MBU9833584.1 hypothetical protein [Rahnella perminowiae]